MKQRLSADNTVACATCHRPDHKFSEPTAVSTGIGGQKGRRKAPSLVNQADALLPHFFWDGRAGSLEDQALRPIGNPIEMGMNNVPNALADKLTAIEGYRPYFRAAFGTNAITSERIAKAIVAYEQTRMSGNSDWDRWRYDRDEKAVSDQAKQGHELFFGKAKCRQCHAGNNFTDSKFHNLGVGWDPVAKQFSDEGRFVVTKKDADRGAFKTPTLRDVTRHPPYQHDGSVSTLREVVELYNRGGHKNPYLDVKMEPRSEPRGSRRDCCVPGNARGPRVPGQSAASVSAVGACEAGASKDAPLRSAHFALADIQAESGLACRSLSAAQFSIRSIVC